ncbi:MAG: imidazole glycerol phosphate synthase subunit HisH [bacterium]|nr:imidazole glycerol phosphate synthase subunit HisH [bacterium]
MIGIVNYGAGNLQSVKNSLDFLSIPNIVINKSEEIKNCDRLILPGVGAFGPAMKKLNKLGFSQEIKNFVGQKKPILGICLGMQLLFEVSEELGSHQGLGLIKGKVLPLNKKVKDLPIPHIGWNNIIMKKSSPLLKNIEDGSCFYFNHSFYCEPVDELAVTADADYYIKISSVVEKDNVYGCQFHPEKSQSRGLTLLDNFQKLI